MSKKFSFIIFITFVLLIILGLSLIALTNRTSIFGLASQIGTDSEISYDNSYVFASPLSAKTSNSEKIRITVFVLNSKGLGVSTREVNIKSDPGISVYPIQNITDNYGKAVFDIVSQNPGEYLLEAEIANVKISQDVTVTFE